MYRARQHLVRPFVPYLLGWSIKQTAFLTHSRGPQLPIWSYRPDTARLIQFNKDILAYRRVRCPQSTVYHGKAQQWARGWRRWLRRVPSASLLALISDSDESTFNEFNIDYGTQCLALDD